MLAAIGGVFFHFHFFLRVVVVVAAIKIAVAALRHIARCTFRCIAICLVCCSNIKARKILADTFIAYYFRFVRHATPPSPPALLPPPSNKYRVIMHPLNLTQHHHPHNHHHYHHYRSHRHHHHYEIYHLLNSFCFWSFRFSLCCFRFSL